MTNNDELKYYEQRIWEFKDVPISDNNLNVSVLFTDSQWGISPARLKFQIANYKRKTFEWMHFTHKDTMLYLSKADNGMSVVQENKQSILNGDTQKGFTCKCDKNITIKTVFLTKSEYGGELCVRLALSEKETGYLDSEVIYLPYIDYLSLITIFKNFRDKYLLKFKNYKVMSCTRQNISWGKSIDITHMVFDDNFINEYNCEFMIYINNKKYDR